MKSALYYGAVITLVCLTALGLHAEAARKSCTASHDVCEFTLR